MPDVEFHGQINIADHLCPHLLKNKDVIPFDDLGQIKKSVFRVTYLKRHTTFFIIFFPENIYHSFYKMIYFPENLKSVGFTSKFR